MRGKYIFMSKTFLLVFLSILYLIPNSYADVEIPLPEINLEQKLLETEINAYFNNINEIIKSNKFSKDNLPIFHYEEICRVDYLSKFREGNEKLSLKQRKVKYLTNISNCIVNEKNSLSKLRKYNGPESILDYCVKRELTDNLQYTDIIRCVDRQAQAKTELETGIAGYEEIMGKICLKDWKGDYANAIECIKRQVEAKKNIEKGLYIPSAEGKKSCDAKWTGNYVDYSSCLYFESRKERNKNNKIQNKDESNEKEESSMSVPTSKPTRINNN